MGRTRQPGGAPPAVHTEPLDPKVKEILDELRGARLKLTADLSAAAGALDHDRPEVARDIVAGDLAELAAFRSAAIARLENDERPVPRRRARSRALLALPAVPLIGGLAMTAAAAISSGSTPVSHHHHAAATHVAAVAAPQPTHSTLPIAAHSTLRRLEHVVEDHGGAAEVIAVANDLHQQLAQIINSSSNDPVQLSVVKRLLSVEQRVLETNKAPGASLALAASREIVKLLDKSTPPVVGALHPHKKTTPKPAATSTKPHVTPSTTPQHHKTTSPPKHTTTSPSPRPTPSNPLLGRGVIGNVL